MILIGRVTKDAVVTQLKDERKVVNFTVAINYYYKPKGKDKGISLATFVYCSYWLTPATADRLTKGSLVEITGRLSVNAYTTIQGEVKASIYCHVDAIKIHQHKPVKSKASTNEPAQDDLPF